MILGKKERKKRHPYMGLAIFGLAAAGAVSIFNCGKKFIKEKGERLVCTMKRARDRME